MTYPRRKAPMRKRPYRRPYKRPTRKSARSSVASIVKRQLDRRIEKKVATPVFSLPGSVIPFGANNNGTSSAWSALDVNPTIFQGINDHTRIGNRIGITSFHFQFNLEGQKFQYVRTAYKICLILRKNVSAQESASDTVKNLFAPNPFTGLIDSNSSLNTGMMANYQILRTSKGVLNAATTNMVNNTGSLTGPATGSKQFSFGYKGKTPMVQRFNADSSTDTTRNSLILVFLAGSNSNTGASTGIEGQFYADFYFNDA